MAKKKRTAHSDSDEAIPLSKRSSDDEVDFESVLSEVEQVVEQLESGELGLSESLAQYERGIKMVKQCHQVLEAAEQRISVLTSVDEDGTAQVEPVERGIQGSRSPASASQRQPKPPKKRVRKPAPPKEENMDDSEGLF